MESEINDMPTPQVGDLAGVYSPQYLEGIVEVVHADGTATLRVSEFRVRCLPDLDDSKHYPTTWTTDCFDPRWKDVDKG